MAPSPFLPLSPILFPAFPLILPPSPHPTPLSPKEAPRTKMVLPTTKLHLGSNSRRAKMGFTSHRDGDGTSRHQENPGPQSCCFAALFSFAVLAAGGAPEQALHTNTSGINPGAQLHQPHRSPRKSSGSPNCLPRESAAQSQLNIPSHWLHILSRARYRASISHTARTAAMPATSCSQNPESL